MAIFDPNPTGTIKVDIGVTAEGYVDTGGGDTADYKSVNIKGFVLNGTLAQADTIFDKFLNVIGGATYDTLTAQRTEIAVASE